MATQLAGTRAEAPSAGVGALSAENLYAFCKRALDVVLALLLLVALAPLVTLISLAIALDSPGPIFFKQKRVLGEWVPGMHPDPADRVFTFYKFRTMYHGADHCVHRCYIEALINGKAQSVTHNGRSVFKLARDSRVTRVGRLLRETSLDELPQRVKLGHGILIFI